jgi:hypothetical protein
MHENRETSGAPRPERERGRSAKAQSPKADAHALEESDRAIVSMNQANKEEQSSAEPGEKRARAKENIVSFNTRPTQCGEIECARDGAVYEEQPSSSLLQGGSRMRESRSYGSVRGAISDGRPYRNTWRGLPSRPSLQDASRGRHSPLRRESQRRFVRQSA